MDTVTHCINGQPVVPKAVREHVQVVPASQFSASCDDGEIRLRPLARAQAVTLDDVAGRLAPRKAAKPGTALRVVAA